jgi:hypothetical protein
LSLCTIGFHSSQSDALRLGLSGLVLLKRRSSYQDLPLPIPDYAAESLTIRVGFEYTEEIAAQSL